MLLLGHHKCRSGERQSENKTDDLGLPELQFSSMIPDFTMEWRRLLQNSNDSVLLLLAKG
jgi:hypothetical protein